MCRACVSPGMRANPSTCGELTSAGTYSVSGRWGTSGRTAGRATRPEWKYSQGVYFEPRAGSKVRILWFYNNKQTNKQTIGLWMCGSMDLLSLQSVAVCCIAAGCSCGLWDLVCELGCVIVLGLELCALAWSSCGSLPLIFIELVEIKVSARLRVYTCLHSTKRTVLLRGMQCSAPHRSTHASTAGVGTAVRHSTTTNTL